MLNSTIAFVAMLLLSSSCAIPYKGVKEPELLSQRGDCVVLMHGLARRSESMSTMGQALLDNGYLVVSQSYPSRQLTIEELSSTAVPVGLDNCRRQGSNRIHFVAHSLGGILVRYYLENNEVSDFGRFVMLAPPNQGSEVIETVRRYPGAAFMLGVAGLQLGTDEATGIPRKLGPVTVPTAVIAGTRTINPLLSQSLPNPDDGKVSVKATAVEGMCASLTVPVAHTFIMNDDRVIGEVLQFLSSGRFARPEAKNLDCPFSPRVNQVRRQSLP